MNAITKRHTLGTYLVCLLLAAASAGCSKSPSEQPVSDDPIQAFNEAYAQAEQNKDDVDKAAAGYEAFIERFPAHESTANALMKLADLYHNEADALLEKGTLRPDSDCVQKAAKAYDDFLQRFPNDPQASNALMKKGLLYKNAGNTPEAIKAYNEFLQRFPNDPMAENVREKLNALKGE